MPSHVVERQEPLTRGELAGRTGCNIETIRYYERIGLLPVPPRRGRYHYWARYGTPRTHHAPQRHPIPRGRRDARNVLIAAAAAAARLGQRPALSIGTRNADRSRRAQQRPAASCISIRIPSGQLEQEQQQQRHSAAG